MGGRLYELDGLKEGPLDLGPIPEGKDWTEVVTTVLQDRINKYKIYNKSTIIVEVKITRLACFYRYNEGEIHFNLMAIVSDRKLQCEKKLAELEATGKATPEKVLELKQMIEDEEAKRQKFKMENVRRKHNYLPLIVEFLKELAQQKQLIPLFEKAKEKCETKSREKQASKSTTV